MYEKNLTGEWSKNTSSEVDYAEKYCADKIEDVEIPHNELSPARKVLCVFETVLMGYLVYLAGSVLVGHSLHLWHKFNIMYAVPLDFFLPFLK